MRSDAVRDAPVIERRRRHHAYSSTTPPALTVDDGASVLFRTADARDGALDEAPVGAPWPLPPPPARGNPVSGPLAVRGARAGDALLVDVLAIESPESGWIGGHAHGNGLPPGRIPTALGRRLSVREGHVHYGDVARVPARPMLGCIGTAPAGQALSTAVAGRHGGNLDHPPVGAGATVWLPVAVPGALLSIGDVHAVQGDGELAGTAVEIAAEVLVRVRVRAGAAPEWPWLVTDRRIAVMTTGRDFAEARTAALDATVSLLERGLGMAGADALALVGAIGDLRLGQAFGGLAPTVRLELPRTGALADLEPDARLR